ncbi:16S rRNA (adenine(1518)-N(6)/adenine(1519)-N(6))-dimethyltransferase RsmA [Liquorilactobacillus sicerae]|uniref:16S rRNA (adenine(1518)-N(6)/adenine(1519)-N(6))- dimethyltransferase RsmA n=1 Tax=Liquorilactobacillus sicerae TaxID=1416943 RepID=UPI00248166E6|nr:16S rRNA (adenine(1518)-N(6)/adenine(1519)-N(6))-dimethyltransferase RsmA [Liquorilactobacillus sicerae]
MANQKPAIATPLRTKAIVEAYDLNFKKSLGQNFLTNLTLLQKMVAVAEIGPDDDVIEIGPGIGALTEQLAQKARRVLALEVDQRLLPVLAETLADYQNITVLHQDILAANLAELVEQYLPDHRQIKVVANLPYYITSPIIKSLLQQPVVLSVIVVMMQKEVAERLAAEPRTKAYGALSVLVQYQRKVELALNVPKTSFVPQPKVDSAVIKLSQPIQEYPQLIFPAAFSRVVQGCFLHRRKNLKNNLQSLCGKDETTKTKILASLEYLQILPTSRPEELTISQFIELTNLLGKNNLL